ncbi:uncharacterized protein [Diabrotica undecimpunctata]|uniref:uncharacterized protein n=1 Tax=Diabrotica undecimpunctata TaxID=50387 RepID=UPI003B636834
MHIIQVYTPISESAGDIVEETYHPIHETISNIPKKEPMMIIRHYNAKIGKTKIDGHLKEAISKHGLGERNERGERLLQFAVNMDLSIFREALEEAHLPVTTRDPDKTWEYTKKWITEAINNINSNDKTARKKHWMTQETLNIVEERHGTSNSKHKEIEICTINTTIKHLNGIRAVKTYSGTNIGSDHIPGIGKISIKLKKIKRRGKIKPSLKKLKDPAIQTEIEKILNDTLKEKFSEALAVAEESVEKYWHTIKTTIYTNNYTNRTTTRQHKKKKEYMDDRKNPRTVGRKKILQQPQ